MSGYNWYGYNSIKKQATADMTLRNNHHLTYRAILLAQISTMAECMCDIKGSVTAKHHDVV